MCTDCLRGSVDITEGIPKQATIHFCRNCNRYLQPPNHWVTCALESRELLALCLKKLKGLNKVRLIDAGFLWTEPHSRRIRVKVTIQKEVFTSAILQQAFEVEYTVSNQQCEQCMRVQAQNTWKAMVQVRQKVAHKRTFFYLEQLMLKHNAHRDTTNIKEAKDGLDFYFGNRNHAIRMVEFLQAVVPCKSKSSEQLISSDIHNNTSNYKFTYSVELAPLCKDDLLCLPPKVANYLGNISPLVLVTRVSNTVHILDVNSLQHAEITSQVFFRSPFAPLASGASLVEFFVLDVEPLDSYHVKSAKKHQLADVHVARMVDFGKNDRTFVVRSHLGYILHPGDRAWGYDLSHANFNNEDYEQARFKHSLADVVLVKKSWEGTLKRRKRKPRNWKLKQLAKQQEEMAPRKQDMERIEQDYELFLRDLEEDPDLRANVNLYRVEHQDVDMMEETEDDMEDDEEAPQVPIEELLADLAIDDDE